MCCRSSALLQALPTLTAAPESAPDCPRRHRPLWTGTSSEEPSLGLHRAKCRNMLERLSKTNNTQTNKKYCLCTFDSSDGVLSMLGLMLCGLSLCVVFYRVLVHARVSRQQTHVVLLTVVANGSPVTERLLQASKKRKWVIFAKIPARMHFFLGNHNQCILFSRAFYEI